MEIRKEDFTTIFTNELASEFGFEYNYFEGYSYTHPKGFSIRVMDNPKVLIYEGKEYRCTTVGDFKVFYNTFFEQDNYKRVERKDFEHPEFIPIKKKD